MTKICTIRPIIWEITYSHDNYKQCLSIIKRRHHKHTYMLEFKKNEKGKWQICYINAVKFS